VMNYCALVVCVFISNKICLAYLHVVILHSFGFKPRMASDKNTRTNIFTIIFLCSFYKGIIAKGESSCYLPKVLVLGQNLILGKPLNCVSN
jgi:hypothetical protein